MIARWRAGDAQQRSENVRAVGAEGSLRLLGGMPEHDHDRFPGRGIHETECAGKAGLVVQRGDQLVGDDPMHFCARLVCGAASNELCVHGLLLSQVRVIVCSSRFRSHRGSPPVLRRPAFASGARS